MNYEQLIKDIKETNKVVLIDIQKCKRAYNDVKLLRFFFCGDYKPLVEKYQSIGFYVMIEKTIHNEYYLRAFWITKEQKQGEDFFNEVRLTNITNGYTILLNKIKELLLIEVLI